MSPRPFTGLRRSFRLNGRNFIQSLAVKPSSMRLSVPALMSWWMPQLQCNCEPIKQRILQERVSYFFFGNNMELSLHPLGPSPKPQLWLQDFRVGLGRGQPQKGSLLPPSLFCLKCRKMKSLQHAFWSIWMGSASVLSKFRTQVLEIGVQGGKKMSDFKVTFTQLFFFSSA